LSVDPDRVSTIAARDPQLTATAVGGVNAEPGALQNLAGLLAQGRLTVPIAARYPIERIREAVTLQASRHVRGKVVIVFR
jgi:NADPH:quinone reductase-like Zn-dependent oxidoreductase